MDDQLSGTGWHTGDDVITPGTLSGILGVAYTSRLELRCSISNVLELRKSYKQLMQLAMI